MHVNIQTHKKRLVARENLNDARDFEVGNAESSETGRGSRREDQRQDTLGSGRHWRETEKKIKN